MDLIIKKLFLDLYVNELKIIHSLKGSFMFKNHNCRLLLFFLFLYVSIKSITISAAPIQNKFSERKMISISEIQNIKGLIISESPNDSTLYPAVIIRDKQLEFKGEDGRIRKVINLPEPYPDATLNEVSYSEVRQYFGIHTRIAGESWGEKDKFSVFDTSGNIVWEADAIVYGTYRLAPSGEYVVALISPTVSPLDPPTIIKKDSTVIQTSLINCEEFFDRSGQYGGLAFSPDGSLIAVRISKINLEGQRQTDILIMDQTGRCRTIFDSDFRGIHDIKFSPSGNILLISGLVKKNDVPLTVAWNVELSKKIWESSALGESVGNLAFSKNGTLVFLAGARRNRVVCLNALDGMLIWVYDCLDDATLNFRSISVEEKKIYLSAQSDLNEEGSIKLVVLDHSGQLIATQTLTRPAIRKGWIPGSIVFEREQIGFLTSRGFQTLDLLPNK